MNSSPMETLRNAARLVRDAVFGTGEDFTQGSLPRAVALLAIPMVLEMSMESLFGFADAMFVSRLGKEALAAVVLTESFLTILFGVAIGLSFATTAMVARRIGEHDASGAAVAAAQALWVGVAVSVAIAAIGSLGARRLLGLMGASAEVIGGGAIYTSILLGSSVTIFLLFLLNAVFRGAGDAAIALRVLMVSNGLNIILDPCLIFGLGPFPELGLAGAATATAIGRGTGVALQLWVLLSGHGRVHLRWQDLRPDWKVMASLVRVSVNGILQMEIGMASWVALVRIMSTFGSEALAGYGLAIRTVIVVLMPAWGMSNAAATLVGQSLGAGKPDRAERAVYLTGFYNMCFLGAVGLVFLVAAERVLSVYGADPAVIPYGVDCLRYLSYAYLFYAWGMVLIQAFNGAGDTWTPTKINFFCFWLCQIPMAYGLALHTGLGPRGVYLAIAVAESLLAAVAMVLFRRGRWKTQKI
ncbi:MAG: MATE family efflux transporter [Bryobacteraceae bacterium]